MPILEYLSLKPYNTFGIDVCSHYFTRINSLQDITGLIEDDFQYHPQILILGSGSNVLFRDNFDGLAIINEIKGIEIIREDEQSVWIKSLSGTVWHDLVLYCVKRNYGGIENLSLIPGTVGAAPMQNIGAYGVELKNVFESLEAIDLETADIKTFSKTDCHFGYRDSIFKNEAKGKYFIYSVTLKLSKKPVINIAYGDIKKILEHKGITKPSIKDVSDAVIAIRSSKLPDPAVLGNAGSFFKNPEVDKAIAENLKIQYPEMPLYPVSENMIKIPAGWLIEQCGWKGKRVGNTGCHKDQALVIVNYGGATGQEIYAHAIQVQQSVKEKFGITIDPEVNLV